MLKSLIKRLFLWRLERQLRKPQSTFCYCPGCRVDLCSNPEAKLYSEGAVEAFTCPCGVHSRWMFDAPIPILIESWRRT